MAHHTKLKRVALIFQGGGSFGDEALGAGCQVLRTPGIKIEKILGVSSGALSALALGQGIHAALHAGKPEQAGSTAIAQGLYVWNQAVKCQDKDMPGFLRLLDDYMLQWGTDQNNATFREVAASYHDFVPPKHRPEQPIPAFLDALLADPNYLHPPHHPDGPEIIVGTTLHVKDGNIWLPNQTHKAFTLNHLAPQERHRLVGASGALPMFKPVAYNGELLCEGAHSSPIPDWRNQVRECIERDITMFIFRTRHAEMPLSPHAVPSREEREARHYNEPLDAIIAEMKTIPGFKFHVIEPGERMESHGCLAAPMRFDGETIARNIMAGSANTSRLLRAHYGIDIAPFTREEIPIEASEHATPTKSMLSSMKAAQALMMIPIAMQMDALKEALGACLTLTQQQLAFAATLMQAVPGG